MSDLALALRVRHSYYFLAHTIRVRHRYKTWRSWFLRASRLNPMAHTIGESHASNGWLSWVFPLVPPAF